MQGKPENAIGLSEANILAHLSLLLASRCFNSSKRLREFLTFVVEKSLSGECDVIKEYVIATEVYDRSPDYDPQIDSTVRVEASRLRARLRDYYASEGLGERLRIELPKGSYVPVFTCRRGGKQQRATYKLCYLDPSLTVTAGGDHVSIPAVRLVRYVKNGAGTERKPHARGFPAG